MKVLAVIVLLSIAAPVFAQAQSTGPQPTVGCGPQKIEFDVTTDDKQRPTAPPDAAKAHVYFLQDDSEFASHPRPTVRFGVDGEWVGATHSNSYFFVSVDPGEHHLCVSWQGIVGIGPQRREAALHFTTAAGTDYYFRANDIFDADLHSGRPAVVVFEPLDSDEAQLLMSKFSFSTSTLKK